ncbi:hypothetical protein VTK73DRAFT_3180 [Phialemonium thermophilum]|uniref:LCCL domain-containing protein n=1 Tax=Phialemonium thermophilum TaxID=223376 RepID=A0ABR3X023_9PEZI
MAAPPSKTIKDLSGKWVMNKSLSSDTDPALALQGVSWLTRKAVGLASITLHVKQYVGPPSPPSDSNEPATHVEIEQTGSGGFKGTTEKRCLDDTWREHSDWLFGHVRGRSRWIAASEIDDAFLAGGWLEGEEERGGPDGQTHILSYVESLDNGWTATQIWGFQTVDGERRYCRNIVVAKGSERVEMRLVYDYIE